MVINALRKKTSDEVLSKKSKLLIRNWKNLIDDKSQQNNNNSSRIKKSKSGSEEPEPVNASNTNNDSDEKTKIKKETLTIPNTSYIHKKGNSTNDPVCKKKLIII